MAKTSKKKIYFWLKLDENFFKNIVIKKARKSAGGDTMVLIYQRMMLQSLSNEGVLYYEGALDNLSEELSLSLDEDVEKIQMTLAFFSKYGLIQIDEEQNAEMLQVHAIVDQETDWARYKRNQRSSQKLDNVQSVSNTCPTEIELEKEKDIELKKDIEIRDIDSNSLLSKFLDTFINFSSKNRSKRAVATAEFIKLPSFQREQAVIGAMNYIQSYKNEHPDDETGQYSVNAVNFLSNMMFMDYQEEVKADAGYDEDLGF
ncbi:phage replisome organizer protein [Lactococcus lactis]|uniref:phage replisome organizer protein n=1 Tax=Lactococcus lactis TaxID=1358 RepID=UPI0025A00E52|nr:phage replisome organiser protein [Lactococcus lactis]MDM7657425.1 phage replisome organizer protein [Lactococcus lactis]